MLIGVVSATFIFQRTIEGILQGTYFTVVRVDGILVLGVDDTDHLHNVEQVLKQWEKAGLKAKSSGVTDSRGFAAVEQNKIQLGVWEL